MATATNVELIVSFHPSVELPSSGKNLEGHKLFCNGAGTVRDLHTQIETVCTDVAGIGVRVSGVINPARGAIAAPHDLVTAQFVSGNTILVLGDSQPVPWPVTQAAQRQPCSPVPITIFTGFLGAGKTTVLNHLLQGQRDKKFAVIENEFGEVPIDNELLQNSALNYAEQVVVMENGCMCCTVRGDLLGAFDSIRRQMELGNPLDAVLVETTGMADPVPIVRTLRQTPDIAKYFRLDGTITLVDTKSILSRLAECAGGADDQERHRQIAFADKILLNKIDLVSADDAVEVFRRIRSYNATVPIVASVKGIVPAKELTNIGAFDINQILAEHEEKPHHAGHGGHGDHAGHGHGHGHEDAGHGGGHDHGHGHGCEDEDHDGPILGHGHNAKASSRHDSEIGSFSIVRRGVEVDPLEFARWKRIIATLPEEQGNLYRSKGVLAARGRSQKLIFHAVADVTETQDGPEWGEDEQKICKMVFIGKKLDQRKIEERYLQMLRPIKPRFRPVIKQDLASISKLSLVHLLNSDVLHKALLGCWTNDILQLSQVSPSFHDALFQPEGSRRFEAAARSFIPNNAPKGLHTGKNELWLHGLLPLRSVARYMQAYRNSRAKLAMPTSVEHLFGEPVRFSTTEDVESLGVTWMELEEIKDYDTYNYLTEFKWRPETMKAFFDVEGSATNSALVKVCVEDPNGDTEYDDDLKFRVNFNPEAAEDNSSMKLHRMSLQLVGGKTSNHIYSIFFHTVDPAYQVHINVPDHRMPIFPTKEVFHQWHPLMSGLRQRPRLRFLLRLKPSELGPLDAMCGCC